MPLTYDSKALDRAVRLLDLSSLTVGELRALQAELAATLESLDETLNRAALPGHDPDWWHRIQKKRRVCKTFADQAKHLLLGGAQADPVERAYQVALERMLRAELGRVYEDIKAEAREAALAVTAAPQAQAQAS